MGDHLSEMAILKTQNALDPAVDITPLNARLAFMFFLPFFLLAPFAGLLADRLPRRAIMVFADGVRMTIMFSFVPLIVMTQGWWGGWGPFVPLLAVGAFAAVFSPARSALLPTIVRPDQLVRANGMIAGLGIIGTMVATVAGGLLAKHYDAQVAFRLNALTFLLSAALLLLMKPPRQTRDRNATSPITDLLAGVRYARIHRHVAELLMIAALFWFCGSLINSVIPAVVRDVYEGGYPMISTYRMLLGVGFVVGAVVVSGLGDALRGEIAITWGLFGISISTTAFALSVFLPLSPRTLAIGGGVAIVWAGIFGVAVMASFNALMQRVTANRFRGRVFGFKDVVCTAALLVATGALGLGYGTRIDAYVGYIVAGVAVITFVAGYVTLRVRLARSPHGAPLTMAESANEFLCRWWWRLQRIGPSTVPREGPVIIVANHRSAADPLFLYAAARYRSISFMVAAEYTNIPIFRYFMRLVECIPVKREIHDTGATKQALRHLKAGKAMGIFIEGGIVEPNEASQPKDGAAMLALKTGAAVVPAYISGTINTRSISEGLLRRHRARIRFGKPVDLSDLRGPRTDRAEVRTATRRIYDAMMALAPPDAPPHSAAQPESAPPSGTNRGFAHESV